MSRTGFLRRERSFVWRSDMTTRTNVSSAMAGNSGLVGDSDWERFNSRQARLAKLRTALDNTRLRRSDAQHAAVSALIGADLGRLDFALRNWRSDQRLTADLIMSLLPAELKPVTEADLTSVLADSLYEGYLDSHKATIARLYQHDALKIPRETAFRSISGLSNEIVERLDRAQPQTFGEARRLPGLTPGALSTLLVFLSAQQNERVAPGQFLGKGSRY